MDEWNKALETANKHAGGGLFVSLKDGDEVLGVFRGNPHIFWKKYPDQTEFSEWEEGMATRFKINLIVKEGDQFVAKVFEQGAKLLNDISEMKIEYTLNHWFKIKRKGSTKDNTKYTLLPKGDVSHDDLLAISKLELKPLKRGDDTPPKNPKVKEKPIDPDDDIPF